MSAIPFPAAAPRKHIVDVLIEERAPHLSGSPLWPILRPPIYSILNYSMARDMGDAIADMGGRQAMEHLSQFLRLRLEVRGIERAPRSGRFLLLANHPTGISDGVAVFDALKTRRPDVLIYANSDAHRVCPGFEEILIPVEWVVAKRTRERTRLTLKMTEAAMERERPIVIFPAGRMARRRAGVLTDPEWMSTAVSVARKFAAPIVPVHVAGPHSFWFHFFASFSKELRDMTLFHELLNKEGATYRLSFGPLIPAELVRAEPVSTARRLKHYVERVLAENPDAAFDPHGPECAWRDAPAPAASPAP